MVKKTNILIMIFSKNVKLPLYSVAKIARRKVSHY